MLFQRKSTLGSTRVKMGWPERLGLRKNSERRPCWGQESAVGRASGALVGADSFPALARWANLWRVSGAVAIADSAEESEDPSLQSAALGMGTARVSVMGAPMA